MTLRLSFSTNTTKFPVLTWATVLQPQKRAFPDVDAQTTERMVRRRVTESTSDSRLDGLSIEDRQALQRVATLYKMPASQISQILRELPVNIETDLTTAALGNDSDFDFGETEDLTGACRMAIIERFR